MEDVAAEQVLEALKRLNGEISGFREDMRTDLAALRSDIDTLISRTESAANGSSGIVSELSGLSHKLHSTSSGISSSIDRLQATVERLRSEVIADLAAAEAAVRHARDTQADVRDIRDVVTVMQQRALVLTTRMDDFEARGASHG